MLCILYVRNMRPSYQDSLPYKIKLLHCIFLLIDFIFGELIYNYFCLCAKGNGSGGTVLHQRRAKSDSGTLEDI